MTTLPATGPAPTRLRVEHGPGLLGITTESPRLSWHLPVAAQRQSAYRVEAVIDGRAVETVVASESPILQSWPFDPLASRSSVSWRVQTETDLGWSTWSQPTTFETGLLQRDDWHGTFIGLPGDGRGHGKRGERGAVYFRRRFVVSELVTQVRVRATALGLYEFHLDGERIGDLELTPGFTDYRYSLEAQTFDIGDRLTPGDHELVATLTDGWYRGSVGFTREEFAFGEQLGLLAQLEFVNAAGDRTIIATDTTWEATDRGPITAADLMEGEHVDLRIPFPPVDGWTTCVEVPADPSVPILSSTAPPTRAVETYTPLRIVRVDDERQVVALPANINGWLRIAGSALGEPGREITVVHGESLAEDGDVDMAPLEVLDFVTQTPLGHGQVDQITSAGADSPAFEPRHTTHGFQYARVIGAPDLTVEDVSGVMVHTDLDRTGWFRCSDEQLNALHDAAVLSFRGNACETPTDCPQRERAGWTGDWQIFLPTATYLYDVAGFSDRWLRNLADAQWPDGRVTNHVPDPVGPAGRSHPLAAYMTGSSGWGDAAVLVPFEIWRAYGDLDLLRRQYPSMQKWVNFALDVARTQRHPTREAARPVPAPHETYLWDAGFHWGEWSEPDTDMMAVLSGQVDQGYVATAYLSRSLDTLAATARLLGEHNDAVEYDELSDRARAAWQAEYLSDDGSVSPSTQANLCRALAFDLVPIGARQAIVEDLAAAIEAADFHVGTGFLTTPFLLPTLADEGRLDLAYRLLLQDTAPSWLAMIDAGATTIWENWEPATAEHPGSQNHYSKGAVVTFLHRYVAGIVPIEGEPGYRRFRIRPQPGGGITWAEGQLDSPFGPIRSEWRRESVGWILDVEVPSGTRAEVVLPDGASYDVGPGHHAMSWA